jgi:hypothetical protein
MSLLVVAALVAGYAVIVLFGVALLRTSKRDDEAAEREHRALLRAIEEQASYPVAGGPDEGRFRRPVRSRAGLRG